MASSMQVSLVLFFACSLFVQQTLAKVICEKLPTNECSFAVASSGKRCVLENENDHGEIEYTCKTSEVVVERLSGYIESDQCVNACGVNRETVGMSADAFLSPEFTARLCSPACFTNCNNIVDLYFNLAASEGVPLPALCHKENHRAMLAVLSNGGATHGPVAAPLASPAPSSF